MRPVLRPFEEADLPEVAKLHALLYRHEGHDDLGWYSSLWRWLESHPLAGEIHRWVLSDEGAVVGFLAAIPQFYRIGGKRLIAHTPMDYMVDPRYRFYSISLMREFFRSCPNCVTCDWLPETVKVTKWLGAEEVGQFQHAAKLLDASAFVRAGPGPIRSPVRGLITGALKLVDRILIGSSDGGGQAEVLENFDERFDSLFENVAAAVPCLPEKDAGFLQWRYGLDSPQAEKRIIALPGEGRLLGYAVLRLTSTLHDGYILDLTVLPGRYDVASALLRHAVSYFRRAGAQVIRYRFLESPTAPRPKDLWRLGFFPRGRRHRLLVKFGDADLEELARKSANWAYTAGDGEMSFWVR